MSADFRLTMSMLPIFFVVILFNITTICEESQSLFKIKAKYTSWHGACTIVKQHQFGPIRNREDTDSFI